LTKHAGRAKNETELKDFADDRDGVSVAATSDPMHCSSTGLHDRKANERIPTKPSPTMLANRIVSGTHDKGMEGKLFGIWN